MHMHTRVLLKSLKGGDLQLVNGDDDYLQPAHPPLVPQQPSSQLGMRLLCSKIKHYAFKQHSRNHL